MGYPGELKGTSAEAERILIEYKRRREELPADLYAPWQPGTAYMLAERQVSAVLLLHAMGVHLSSQSRCLEVGYGSQGWLTDLIRWGVSEKNLSGIELDVQRATAGMALLPSADLRIGDGANLPWGAEEFDIVVASVLFTSILDSSCRSRVAEEITRVLKPGGVLVWYDFRVNNPFNKNVRKVTQKELKQLFPKFGGKIRSLTPVPQISRLLARLGWFLPALLGLFPVCRTHLLAVLRKG